MHQYSRHTEPATKTSRSQGQHEPMMARSSVMKRCEVPVTRRTALRVRSDLPAHLQALRGAMKSRRLGECMRLQHNRIPRKDKIDTIERQKRTWKTQGMNAITTYSYTTERQEKYHRKTKMYLVYSKTPSTHIVYHV